MGDDRKPHIGDRIRISYLCRDASDGSLLEDTTGEEPSVIRLGDEDVLPVLERHFLGMQPGGKKTVTVKPGQAFGPYYEDLVYEVPLEMLSLSEEPELGETVELAEEGQEPIPGTIIEIDEESVLVDCNHPMAGKTLQFELYFLDYAGAGEA